MKVNLIKGKEHSTKVKESIKKIVQKGNKEK